MIPMAQMISPRERRQADRWFANVALLLHMDGADGGSDFIDSSSQGHSVFANGGVAMSSAAKRFGATAGAFDGVSDYLEIPGQSDWLSQVFTVEAWFRALDLSLGKHGMIEHSDGASYWRVFYNTDGVEFRLNDGVNSIQCGVAALVEQTWHHVAVSRQDIGGGEYITRVFIDGYLSDSQTDNAIIQNISGSLYIGADFVGTNRWWDGHIDEVRITKGVARYTSNFVPPTAAFPDR